MFGDNEFRPLESWLIENHIEIETCNAKAHVPTIERTNCFLKERIRCIRCNMPFSKLPRHFLIEIVLRTTVLINLLPRKNGVHPVLSHREIVTGKNFLLPQHEIMDYI